MIILLDKTIAIFRLEEVAGDKIGYTTLTTTLEATIQPLGAEKSQMYGGTAGKLYVIFLDVDKDIKEGDEIRDKNGNIYKVVAGGVDNRDDGLIADYLSITVRKVNG